MINFNFELIEKGWVKATISNEKNIIIIFSSFLSDGLHDLINSVCRIAQGDGESSCSWQEEPGQYRWLFSRKGNQVTLRILWFDDTFSRASDERGVEKFCGSEILITFERNIIRAFDGLKYKYGIDEYKRIYAYDFPKKDLERLKLLFRELKNSYW